MRPPFAKERRSTAEGPLPVFNKSQAFYEAINARGKDYAAEAAWLRAAISVANPGAKRILDVACGTGAHLSFLHKQFEVAGEDADATMIAIAKERLPGVPFHVGRMQDLTVDRPFDAVMCLFGSITYVADEAELFSTIRRFAGAAVTGGLVIIEPWIVPDEWRDDTIEASFVDQPKLKIARIGTTERYDTSAVTRYEYLVGETTGMSGFSETHVQQLFTQAQYRAAFEAAGLKSRSERSDLFPHGLYVATKR
jgi:ubiquinone/menaquinone biosynthesis C-methylase UbiE